jgi:acyl-homoserine lactone synthase
MWFDHSWLLAFLSIAQYASPYYREPPGSDILKLRKEDALEQGKPCNFRTASWRMSMIHVVTPENEHFYHNEMDQAYRLRHKVFVEEMGRKDLSRPDRREIDQFDTKHAVNMLYIEGGEVLGYQRLLPSTRPHLLSEITPELCEGERPVGAHVWEISRHCIAPGHRTEGRFANPVANALGTALVEWGLECGITKFVIEIEPMGILPLIQLNFQPMPLGLPKNINGRDVIAVTLTFDGRTLEQLRQMRGTRRRVLAETLERPTLLHA